MCTGLIQCLLQFLVCVSFMFMPTRRPLFVIVFLRIFFFYLRFECLYDEDVKEETEQY